CYSNLQAPIPPIWTAFDSAWLVETIDGNQQARRSSTFRRMRNRALVAYLRNRRREEWHRIERELERQDSAETGRGQDRPHDALRPRVQASSQSQAQVAPWRW